MRKIIYKHWLSTWIQTTITHHSFLLVCSHFMVPPKLPEVQMLNFSQLWNDGGDAGNVSHG